MPVHDIDPLPIRQLPQEINDQNIIPFLNRLLHHIEKHGPHNPISETPVNETVPLASITHANIQVPLGMAISPDGDHLYICSASNNRLIIADISDPSNPTVVGSVGSSTNLSQAFDVTVDAAHAYVTSEDKSRLTVVDIGDPTAPTVVGSVLTASFKALRYVVGPVGNYVFAGDAAEDKLYVVDISTPSAPTVAGSLVDATNLDEVNGLALSPDNQYIFAAARGSGRITAIDISTPTTPTVAHSIAVATGASTIGVAVNAAGTVAVLNATSTTVAVIDISTPTAMVAHGSVTDPDLGTGGVRGWIDIQGDYAIFPVGVSSSGALAFIDISTPGTPTVAHVEAIQTGTPSGLALADDGFHAYVSFTSGPSGPTDYSVEVVQIGEEFGGEAGTLTVSEETYGVTRTDGTSSATARRDHSHGSPPQLPAYTVSNFTVTRTLDASTATLTDVANFLATLVSDLQTQGIAQ